jgi:hypothetical protein
MNNKHHSLVTTVCVTDHLFLKKKPFASFLFLYFDDDDE